VPSGTAETANQAIDPEGPAGESNSPQPVGAEQPAAGDSTATTITQQAEAGAVATQEGASNSTTTSSGVPQTGGGVAQGNGASADATASTDASVALEQQPGAGSTDVVLTTDLTQAVGATAEVHQGATNTAIVVRNDAPGDDGPVSQANTAGATASGSATGTTAGNAGLSDAPSSSSQISQDVQAGAIATQSGVANTNVSVRVNSPGDSGTVSQANTATATAAATASDPTAATQAESTPAWVLARQAQNKLTNAPLDRRPPAGPLRLRPPAAHQISMPTQQRLRGHNQALTASSRKQSAQGGEQGAISRHNTRSRLLPTKHCKLMTQNQQFDVLGELTAAAAHEQPQQRREREVGKRKKHPPMLPDPDAPDIRSKNRVLKPLRPHSCGTAPDYNRTSLALHRPGSMCSAARGYVPRRTRARLSKEERQRRK
jgi:hypothetical protein